MIMFYNYKNKQLSVGPVLRLAATLFVSKLMIVTSRTWLSLCVLFTALEKKGSPTPHILYPIWIDLLSYFQAKIPSTV